MFVTLDPHPHALNPWYSDVNFVRASHEQARFTEGSKERRERQLHGGQRQLIRSGKRLTVKLIML
jgi:hypothetical protein